MTSIDLSTLEQRFIRYVQIDTQSDADSDSSPSTAKQLDLLQLLAAELQELGAEAVVLTDYGYVLATIPPTAPAAELPTVAFLAHVDTAPDYPGGGVRPIVHRNYSGQPIILPDDPGQVLTSAQLQDKIGEDIITAGGTTLLGADDKAGIAIIMTLAEQLLQNREIPHGKIRLCFNPDEEIGRGVDKLSLAELDADVAYTLDGSTAGEIVYETFSADKAIVTITGVAIHPGWAKGEMVNALRLAGRFAERLPRDSDTPETTAGREGYIHLHEMHGNAAQVELRLILRDFELEGLEARGELIQALCDQLQAEEPRSTISCAITPQYRNMRYWLAEDMRPVQMAIEAIQQAGLPPIEQVIRGGTDGSQLTERGLPTPNLFTGGHNFHGPLEWVSLQDMGRAVETCLHLARLWAKKGAGYRSWR